MANGMLEILNAPWVTVLTLASGYAGYFVAHVGLSRHHQPMDQAFRVVLYGFFGIFAYLAARTYAGLDVLSASALCMIVTVGLGALWRRELRHRFTNFLRDTGVSQSDDLPKAWMAIPDVGQKVLALQLGVVLTDGTKLHCEDLARFSGQPNGPCVLGGEGDVLLYVTQVGRRGADGQMVWKDNPLVVDEHGAAQITYVPREQIARIDLRRVRRG